MIDPQIDLRVDDLKRRIREASRLHTKTSTRYQGLTPAGLAHLEAGGEIGPDGMPISEAMNPTAICAKCGEPAPCETYRILLSEEITEEGDRG